MGTLKGMSRFDKLYKECFMGSKGNITLKYLGDDLEFIEGIDGSCLADKEKDENEETKEYIAMLVNEPDACIAGEGTQRPPTTHG